MHAIGQPWKNTTRILVPAIHSDIPPVQNSLLEANSNTGLDFASCGIEQVHFRLKYFFWCAITQYLSRQSVAPHLHIDDVVKAKAVYAFPFWGEASKPMPHLFLISDEFAELKKEQPEFMSELVSTARIGRSLGIHLILATQKPTGVVDDQIWSNSKFKLALKVQDKSDSNEVLKTPDAANITLPGRAYLQVGNNEIYELFQSAWSGAPFVEAEIEVDFDERVYEINSLGQRKLLGKDLSGNEKRESRTTQLDAVVEHISEIFASTGQPIVERPWHPPLNNSITSPYFDNIIDVSMFEKLDSKISIGMVDIPEEQVQTEFIYDFKEDGNIAVFGSSTSGKSVTLTTILMSAAVKNSPNWLKYYIFDFGNSSLVPLKALPHTADYVSM